MKYFTLFILSLSTDIAVFAQAASGRYSERPDSVATHKVVLDSASKIVSWIVPQSAAYDQFLRKRWDFIKSRVPQSPGPAPRSHYPQYYFYCAFWYKNGVIEPDHWMNDVAEKIPNWFESARLYYQYSGDTSVMTIVKDLMDYALAHGISAVNFAWPNFPYTTTNAGDTLFRGFTSDNSFVRHEVQVDHAGEIGLTLYRLFQYTADEKYKTAAVKIANTLVGKVRPGTAEKSPWPYLVVMNTGKIISQYGANWTGCYQLFDNLIRAGIGKVDAYREANKKVRTFLLDYPMKTGYWTDGHTDNNIRSNTYKSNLSASNIKLYMFDHPQFNTSFQTDIPKLIRWTEENFIFRTEPGEPATQWGANLVGEQDTVLIKMDYQTARYAAECARWFAISGDEQYKEKAYRALNWVTYCSDSSGQAVESPVSKPFIASNWWSDEYGEGPRMFYHVFAAIPEWAPPGQNHILYSAGVLVNVQYCDHKIQYASTDNDGTEFLRVAFKPGRVTINGKSVAADADMPGERCVIKELGNGDYAITVHRSHAGIVIVE